MMNYTCKPGRIDIRPGNEYAEKTVGDFLNDLKQSSAKQYLLIRDRQILVNHEPVRQTACRLQKEDLITVLLPPQPVDFAPAETECAVRYEDDFVYVAHKKPQQIVHGEPGDTACLAAQAAAYQLNHDIQAPVRYIHRLDRDTRGLILFVKHPFFQPWYDNALASRQIHRHYLAICQGSCKPGRKFTLNQPIGRDRHVSGKYRISKTGKPAVTAVECLGSAGPYLLFGCLLQTGRTHQIRVHLAAAGFPIVNDPLYGVPAADFAGMGLWADQITFSNPLSQEICQADDEPQEDFIRLQKQIADGSHQK